MRIISTNFECGFPLRRQRIIALVHLMQDSKLATNYLSKLTASQIKIPRHCYFVADNGQFTDFALSRTQYFKHYLLCKVDYIK
jgi:hypothetical protein